MDSMMLLMGYNSSPSYVVAEQNNKIIFINDAAKKLIGHNVSEYLGKSVEALVGESFYETLRHTLDSGELFTADECNFFEVPCRLELYPGDISIYVFSPSDKLEDAERSMINKSSEFTNPLSVSVNAIMQSLGNLKRYQENAIDADRKLAENYSRIERGIFQIYKMVDNMRSLTDSYSDEDSLNLEKDDIVAYISSLVDKAQEIFKHKSIPLSFQSGVDSFICSFDKYLLERMIYNLLANSATFTRDGNSVSVNLSFSKTHCYIKVIDNGLGIKPENITSVFSPGGGRDASHPDSYGLGMTIVKNIARKHGGSVAIESRDGVSTTITVSISTQLDNRLSLGQPAMQYDRSSGFSRLLLEMCNVLDSAGFSEYMKNGTLSDRREPPEDED